MRNRAGVAILIMLVGACGKPPVTQHTRSSNYIAVASEGPVLVIPLGVTGDQLTSRFHQVRGTGPKGRGLLEALSVCPVPLYWVDRVNFEWQAIVIASAKSQAWHGEFPLKDAELVACIQRSTSETFFVAKSNKGYDTHDLQLLNKGVRKFGQ